MVFYIFDLYFMYWLINNLYSKIKLIFQLHFLKNINYINLEDKNGEKAQYHIGSVYPLESSKTIWMSVN
jgi:hypothetical protein